MSRILFIIAVVFSLQFNAQMTSGSQAPDFTSTDINGNTVDMSDILASGKSVMMDISATWCGPCWGFHETHVMNDLEYAFGPNGSDEIEVLFVEGDASTTMADLQGNTSGSQGDWITGANYKIIDDASIASAYQISYFPTFYTICSNGIVTHLDQSLVSPTLEEFISRLNSCNTLQGVPNHAKIFVENLSTCDSDNVNFSISFKNYGSNNITSATVEILNNNSIIASSNYSGNLAQFSEGEVAFSNLSMDPNGVYTAVITSINGATPHNQPLVVDEFTISASNGANTNMITVEITTDYYPAEMSWKIFNSSGAEVAAGGNYQAGTANQWGGGGPDANTVKSHDVTLPNSDDCYTIELYDSYGDGWGSIPSGASAAGVNIKAEGSSVFQQDVANFGSLKRFNNAFSVGILGVDDIESNSLFSVYPNPTSGIVNYQSELSSNLEVLNLSGELVYTQSNIQPNTSIDLSKLAEGIYILKLTFENDEVSQVKLIKK